MIPSEQKRFDELYQHHLRALKLQGLSASTIDVYARAVRRIAEHFDCCPDQLTNEQLEAYFCQLVDAHSWSTVKIDRNGLQFFWKHVLKKDWSWIKIIKPPKVQTLPDILTLSKVEQLIGATLKLRYRVFLLTTSSIGLRLGETLALELPIHAPKKWVVNCKHIGRGEPALQYLSRYLYRGVLSERNIVANREGRVTFSYVDSDTGKTQYRTQKGEDFLWLVIQHVLPKGFRRVRDYGFLDGNARKLLSLVQLILHVLISATPVRERPCFHCPKCQAPMQILGFIRPAGQSG